MRTQTLADLNKPIGSPLEWISKLLFCFVLFLSISIIGPRDSKAQLAADLIDQALEIESPRLGQVNGIASSILRSQKHPVAYDGVILQGQTLSALSELLIRFGESQEWKSMYVVNSATSGDFLASYRGDLPFGQEYFELAFVGVSPTDVQIMTAGYFNDEEEGRGDTNSSEPTTFDNAGEQGFDFAAASGIIKAPKIHPRAEWGAESSIGSPSPLAQPSYNYVTFHHAAGFGAVNLSQGIAQVKAIQDFHQNGRGWSDIGYHFVVDEEGNLYQGRPYQDPGARFEDAPALIRGAHAGGANTGNIGVCLLGCYHPPETAYSCTDSISPAARDSMTAVFSYLMENYSVEPSNLRGHRDFGNTSCPGDNNYRLIPDIKLDIEDLLTFGRGPADSYVLESPFPNPTSTETKLAYYLLRDGIATLKVYDALGREQTTLVSEFQDAGRWYTFDYGMQSLSPGVYFANLSVEGFNGVDFEETVSIVKQ